MILAESLVAVTILVGSFFVLVGSFALVKLPDLLRRLHGPTKATTLGVGALLVASMLYRLTERNLSLQELLITLFLFLTAPVSAQMIAKIALLRDRGIRKALPPTGRPVGWATLDPGAAAAAAPPDTSADVREVQ